MPTSGRPAATTRLRALALGLVASLVLVVLAEVGLRAAGRGPPPTPSPFAPDALLGTDAGMALPDEDLFYRLTPETRLLGYYRINALGYRGPPVAPSKRRDTLRLVATGDSSTFGLGVPEAAAWPFVLGDLLRACIGDLHDVEVIDAGVPGYTSQQNLEQIRRDLLPLRPDLLAWCPMGHNDASGTLPPNDVVRLAARRGIGGFLRGLALTRGLLPGPPPPEPLLPDDERPTVPRIPLPDFEANLREGARLALAAGVPLLLVAPAHSDLVREELPAEREAEERVVQVAAAWGLPLADPRAELDALAGRPVFPDSVHPGTEAQAVIARHAFDALARGCADLLPAYRRAFARALVGAFREGIADHAGTLAGERVPPGYERLRAAAAGLPLAGMLPAGTPAELARFDPLLGSEHAGLSEAAARLAVHAARAHGDPAAAAAAAALAEDLATQVRPRDPLLLLLAGPEGTPDERADRAAAALSADGPPAALPLARALVAFSAAIAPLPAPRDARVFAAQRAVDAGRPEEGLALAEEVLARHPASAEAELARGAALERLGRRPEALDAYERGAALAPDSPLGAFLLGKASLQRGELDRALAALDRALAAEPTLKVARLARAQALVRLGRDAEAEEELLTLRRLGTADVPGAAELLAAVRERLGR